MPDPQQGQPDPWEEAAKQFKPQGGPAPATTTANEDWKIWQPTQGAAPQYGKGLGIDPHAMPHTLGQLGHEGVKALSNIGAGGLGLLSDIGRATPPGVALDAYHEQPTIYEDAFKAIQHPWDTLKSMGHGAQEHPLETAEQMVGGAGVGAAAELSGAGLKNLRPTPSPDVVPPSEMAARKLSQAVLPATKDATGFIQAADKEVPNVLAYAREQKNPLNTQLEFSKAAQGSAQQARDFYEKQVLEPNDKMVETTGTGFGRQTGEGPKTYAKLSDIDKRVVEINKQLDKPSLNVDDQRRALASKTELQQEARSLTQLLHQHLSDATGIPPEGIADLRQRVGRSYELAHDTDAAVTARMQGEGQSKLGDLPLSKIPARLVEMVRGGPTAIADRQFQRAIKGYPGEAQPLPGLRPIVPSPANRIDSLVQDIRNRRTQ